MMLHKGERVFWGAVEVIYLEGSIVALDETAQTVVVHIERTTPHSAHLIGSDISFAANGIRLQQAASPPGTTDQPGKVRLPTLVLDDEEKIHRAALVAVHQQYGYTLEAGKEQDLARRVAQTLNDDPVMRTRIIASMDEILRHEW